MVEFAAGSRVRFETGRGYPELHGRTGVIVEIPGIAGFDCEIRLDGQSPYPAQETIGARFGVLVLIGEPDA
jgi:hypothetical protein